MHHRTPFVGATIGRPCAGSYGRQGSDGPTGHVCRAGNEATAACGREKEPNEWPWSKLTARKRAFVNFGYHNRADPRPPCAGSSYNECHREARRGDPYPPVWALAGYFPKNGGSLWKKTKKYGKKLLQFSVSGIIIWVMYVDLTEGWGKLPSLSC